MFGRGKTFCLVELSISPSIYNLDNSPKHQCISGDERRTSCRDEHVLMMPIKHTSIRSVRLSTASSADQFVVPICCVGPIYGKKGLCPCLVICMSQISDIPHPHMWVLTNFLQKRIFDKQDVAAGSPFS